MFKHFIKQNDPFKTEYPVKLYTKFEYIKRRYFGELIRIKEYYRNRVRVVNNSHILSRMVDLLAPSSSLDIVDYVKQVSYNARSISRRFDVVSNVNIGKVLSNEL